MIYILQLPLSSCNDKKNETKKPKNNEHLA